MNNYEKSSSSSGNQGAKPTIEEGKFDNILDEFENELSIEELDNEYANLKPSAKLAAEINNLRQNSAILLGDAEKRKSMLAVGISVDKFLPDAIEV